MFGVVLSVLVAGLHVVLDATKNKLMLVTSMFGVIWVGMVIAAGMIGTTGLSVVLDVAQDDPGKAQKRACQVCYFGHNQFQLWYK